MSGQRYTPEFKDEAVRQVTNRGHTVAKVAERLGVSAHSLYKWVKAVKPDRTEAHAAELTEAKSEVLGLRAQLRRTEEERDILKNGAVLCTRATQLRQQRLGGVCQAFTIDSARPAITRQHRQKKVPFIPS